MRYAQLELLFTKKELINEERLLAMIVRTLDKLGYILDINGRYLR